MRVPLHWLLEYCDPGLDVPAIEERLTMTGTKVEAIHHHGVDALDRFVVGHVLSVEPHPDADRLRVCEVDLGQARPEGPAKIVCGAPNVAAGQLVAVAMPGAVMPDGSKLKAAKLRGVPSEGMILAEDELAIGGGHKGIVALNELADAGLLPEGASLRPGAPLAQALPIAEEVIELEVTPNRPDCLGVYGVARELHAATGAPLATPPWAQDPGSAGPVSGASVSVECPDLCPRFTARVFEEVRIGSSPPWLKARLSAAGQRPINNVVDITNYVMLATGQPLHAFDLDRVAGGRLTVRRGRDGETMVTLDGQERRLDSETIVIDDEDGPTSLAGVMGGSRSEVQGQSTRVLLEVASWHGPSIHRASWRLGLRSEASSRFEKGLAPEQCMQAQALASALMVELCGAKLAQGTIDVGGRGPEPARIRLRSSRVSGTLGVEVPVEREEQILAALDFETSRVGEDLDVIVPPLRRNDITREADLIEEVARIDGLERLPSTLPARRGAYGVLSHAQRLRRRAVDALVGRGLYETVGWSFASPTLAERLRLAEDDPRRRDAVIVQNPLSEEQSRLRSTLIGCLLDAAARNVARGMGDLRIFEVGTVFTRRRSSGPDGDGHGAGGREACADGGHPDGDGRRESADAFAAAGEQTGVCERRALALLLNGRMRPAAWRGGEPELADFHAGKGVLEALAAALRVSVECVASDSGREPFLHPGRSASVLVRGREIGWIGELHPLVAESWGLLAPGGSTPAAMEIDLDELLAAASAEGAEGSYTDLISFPELRRDLAVTLPAQVSAAEAVAVVRKAGGRLLSGAEVFDVYTGPQVGEGRRSLAISLSFRASDRTLSDEEVAPLREKILAALTEMGGQLRA